MKNKVPNSLDVIIIGNPWSEIGTLVPDGDTACIARSSCRGRGRVGTWSLAAALTLVIHSFVAGPVILGMLGHKPYLRRDMFAEGADASSQKVASSEPLTMLVLLNARSITPPDDRDEVDEMVFGRSSNKLIHDELIALTLTPTATVGVGSNEDSNDDHSFSPEANGDTAGHAMLFGRYMGQIKARIERAWIQPAMLADNFNCKVQIKQDQQGNVEEVQLLRCNGTPEWQSSLVMAIQSASPLCAPPNEAVFSSVITLNFDASAPQTTAMTDKPAVR